MLTPVEIKWLFPTPGHQRVLKLRGDAQQIFVNGEFSGGSSGFWDYTIYVNPYMVVRPEGHYTKHIYVNSQRIASKIGNPEDYAGGDPTAQGQGNSVGRKVKMEEVVEENFTELFGSIPEIEPAADESLGMSDGGSGGEPHQYWFTSDHQVSLPLDKYRKVAVDFCSDQGARKEYSLSYTTDEQRRYEQKDQDLVCLNVVVMTLSSSAFVTDASGVAIQHLEYMAFGEVFVDQRRTGFGTPYKFNAKELDCESGYYYYSARYYDPKFGRFLGVDPIAGDFPHLSSYNYAENNPASGIDLHGLQFVNAKDARFILQDMQTWVPNYAVIGGQDLYGKAYLGSMVPIESGGGVAKSPSRMKLGGLDEFRQIRQNLTSLYEMSPKIQDGSRLDKRFGSTKGYQKFSGQAGGLGRAGLVAVGIGLTIDGINSYNSYSEAISGMDYNGQSEMVNKSWRTALEAALFGEIPMNRADISSVADFIYRGTPINDSQLQSIADKLAKDMGIYQHRSAIRTESGLDNYHGQYIITD